TRFLGGGQLVARGFLMLAHEKHPPGKCRIVPGLLRECRDFPQLDEPPWIRPHENHLARFSLDDQQIARQKHLAVLVASGFPQPLSGFEIEARENAVVQSIHVTVVNDGRGEFRFHLARSGPDGTRIPRAVGSRRCDVEQHASLAIAGAEEDSPWLTIDDDWLRTIDMQAGGP